MGRICEEAGRENLVFIPCLTSTLEGKESNRGHGRPGLQAPLGPAFLSGSGQAPSFSKIKRLVCELSA